jgi:hypothetical protein
MRASARVRDRLSVSRARDAELKYYTKLRGPLPLSSGKARGEVFRGPEGDAEGPVYLEFLWVGWRNAMRITTEAGGSRLTSFDLVISFAPDKVT